MILLAIGCNYRTTPVELRERLAFDADAASRALEELGSRYDCEAVILSTCNRVELYLARTESHHAPRADLIAEFLEEIHSIPAERILPVLYEHVDTDAVRHLFRVTSSLDSMILGEGQIAKQVKEAYEQARRCDAVGPYLNALFQHALVASKRVRTETGIARGHVSVSSAAVDYVRQVFDHFHDKTVLVIGAGKMGEITLRHLQQLKPKRILVTNRSVEKATEVAQRCGGVALPWQQLDDAVGEADIILSTTGAPEPIMTYERYRRIPVRRASNTVVILDIAVPRDWDPRIHDGDRTCLFNIDDLKQIREQTLNERLRHVPAAEEIIEEEVRRFQGSWSRRRLGPVIAKLTQDFEAKRQEVVAELMRRLDGRLSEEDKQYIEGAFRLLQNRFLHGPISALTEEAHEPRHHTLLDALFKLFRLQD